MLRPDGKFHGIVGIGSEASQHIRHAVGIEQLFRPLLAIGGYPVGVRAVGGVDKRQGGLVNRFRLGHHVNPELLKPGDYTRSAHSVVARMIFGQAGIRPDRLSPESDFRRRACLK
jgi:hypothetical protein